MLAEAGDGVGVPRVIAEQKNEARLTRQYVLHQSAKCTIALNGVSNMQVTNYCDSKRRFAWVRKCMVRHRQCDIVYCQPETLIAQAIQPQNASKTAARAIFKIKNPASGCPAEGNESNLALWKRLATVSNCVFGTGNWLMVSVAN